MAVANTPNERCIDSKRDPTTCNECAGHIRWAGGEPICERCGLVFDPDWLDRRPTRSAHGPRSSGPAEWACEPTTAFRVHHGLGSRFSLGRDGQGRPLSPEQRRRFGRLRRLDRRMDKRDIRLNEALRDVQSVCGNLDLPTYIGEDACRVMRQASSARLPGGRMAWEALAGGAVCLSTGSVGLARPLSEVAEYAKTDEERLCAAARKLRIELRLDVPPVRRNCLETATAALTAEYEREIDQSLLSVARTALNVADAEAIGPGTPRLTVAGAALYAAQRDTGARMWTQTEVAAAISTVLPTTTGRIARYSREITTALRQARSE